MAKLSAVGRIFYGTAMAGLGFQTMYDHEFPYMLIPYHHAWIPNLTIVAYIAGAMLVLAGACIVFEKKTRQASLLVGAALLVIFLFYFIPYQFTIPARYTNFLGWENAEKELALAGGAFIIAGCFPAKNESAVYKFLAKLIPCGIIFFCIPMIIFGTLHFLYTAGVAGYIPLWIPYKMMWAYLGGTGLLGSGIAIILGIKPKLFATLLGSMILIWFIILHIPKVIYAPVAERGGELTSGLIALAYSGTAFVIAGGRRERRMNYE